MGIRREMLNHFESRTKRHIELVCKYIDRIVEYNSVFKKLADRKINHDKSKFEAPEKEPYIYTTWKYKCEAEGKNWKDNFQMPEDIQNKMIEATIHHIIANKHHPEYWDKNFDANAMFNTENRDGVPKQMVDGTAMGTISIAEMIADWCAVSEERKTNPMDWLNMNVNKRWEFNEMQVKVMKKLINEIWKDGK